MKSIIAVSLITIFAAGPAFAGGAAGGVTCTCKSNLSAVAPKGSQGGMLPLPPPVYTLPKPKPN